MKFTLPFLQRMQTKRTLCQMALATMFLCIIYRENYFFALLFLGVLLASIILNDRLLPSLVLATGIFTLISSCPLGPNYRDLTAFIVLAITVVIIMQSYCLIIKLLRTGEKKSLVKQLANVCVIYSLLLVLLSGFDGFNITGIYFDWDNPYSNQRFFSLNRIQFEGISAIVRIMKPSLLRRIQPSSGNFRYHEFSFGSFGCVSTRVAYDESDQILLPAKKRSEEWWKVTGKSKEGLSYCVDPAKKIDSHFFIVIRWCS